jgi:putative phosphoribosyl transferase
LGKQALVRCNQSVTDTTPRWTFRPIDPVLRARLVRRWPDVLARRGEKYVESNQRPAGRQREIEVPAGAVRLPGTLRLSSDPRGIVLYAHGSGSGRFSPRNQYVARVLEEAGFATLLLDLLTEPEAADRAYVFDIPLLADRLRAATAWVVADPDTRDLPIGYFGASTGAGAALVAAAEEGARIGAVVSRGGRPDLAHDALPRVASPTLLIVGGYDEPVIELNQVAFDQLRVPKDLVIVPRATHLFEEPGALEEVARLATAWFARYLGRRGAA